MRFIDSSEMSTFRETVRDFIARNWPSGLQFNSVDEMEAESDPVVAAEREKVVEPWLHKLGENGWIAPAWPKQYGGAGLGYFEQYVLAQELTQAGAVPSRRSLNLVGPTLLLHGTDEQKARFLPPMLRGELRWTQGFSEPGSGSDLASLQTRAVRDGDDYLVNGQKIWTSGAHRADWIFMLVRTNPEAPKHRGISYLLADMKTPGINVRPLVNMAGLHSFNETFFSDVRVPVTQRIGEENRGWYVATTTLDFERSNISRATECKKLVRRMAGYVRARKEAGAPVRQAYRLEVADRAIESEVCELQCLRVVTIQANGGVPNMEASMNKMYGSELNQRIASTQMHLSGMAGQLRQADAMAVAHRLKPATSYLTTVSATIAAGTSEIQRNIIAERGLGLPRG